MVGLGGWRRKEGVWGLIQRCQTGSFWRWQRGLLGVWLPEVIFLGIAKSLVGGFELPDFDLFEGGWGADGEGGEAGSASVIGEFGEDRLAVVDEDLDEEFIDEDAEFDVFAFGEIGDGEGGFGVAEAERAGFWAEDDGESPAFGIGKEVEAEEFAIGLITGDGDADFGGVAVETSDLFAGGGGGKEIGFGSIEDDIIEDRGIVAEGFEFAERFDAEGVILGEAEFAGEGLDGPFVHGAVIFAEGGEPSPHHAPAIGGEEGFWGKEIDAPLFHAEEALVFAAPVHPAVGFGDELFGFGVPVADVVAAAGRVADAEEHPFFSDGKELGTGDVFTEGDIGEIVFEEIADERPSF
jgi:hypothetical protein